MDSRKFMKPPSDEVSWREDRQDVDEITGTTFIYNRFLNLEIEKQRCLLPIHKYKKHILYLLEKYQTLVLVGDTGSGKSTQVCQYLYENGWVSDNTKIGITEPRRFCVTTLAQRVAEEKNCTLGSIVGYSIRFDDCQDEKLTKIKYMTEGILIREMMADPLLRQYRVIIVDEVHERNILTDIILGLLKKILKKRKKLKLIVTSATVDAVSLRDFFNFKKSKTEEDTSVILAAEGKLHPVTIHYTIEPVPDYVDAVVDCVCKIHEREPEGDILAFLTGSEEVNRAVSLLREHLSENPNKNFTPLILPMYGTLPNNDQLKVFRPAPRGMRKIVISTNIAETSVTIWGIVYVVDCGFVKLKWFNPKTYTDSLVVVPISQASAEQRAGRAGRTRPGKVYRLYPEEEFEKLAVATPPEMSRTDLSQAVLQLKALGISNILRFSFPSPPPAQNLLLALELLYALNAIDDRGELTKPLGITMAEFPLPPLHAKTLISAGDFGCTDEISSILAMLQVDDVFIRPRFGENSIKAQIEKRNFEVHEGDLITYLNVFTAFEKNLESAKRWCMQHFINYKALRRAFEIKYRMLQMLERFDIPKTSCDGNTELVCRSIASGFFSNAAYLQFSGVYKTVRGGEELYVHPTSVLYSVEQPQWLLYCELIHTDKLYMRDVTVIQCSWLEELAPNFYHKVPSASAL